MEGVWACLACFLAKSMHALAIPDALFSDVFGLVAVTALMTNYLVIISHEGAESLLQASMVALIPRKIYSCHNILLST